MDDKPTRVTLFDTVSVLNKRNPLWHEDDYLSKVFIWQTDLFVLDHIVEVCKEKCPDLLKFCLEYRECKTINGEPLSPYFGFHAFATLFFKESILHDIHGTSPVTDTYFGEMKDKNE